MKCRHCETALDLALVDLGSSPPSNAYLAKPALNAPEAWYPLRVLVCEACWLVQTEDFTQAHALFDAEYAYFSGFSTSWLEHCQRYCSEMAQRFSLGKDSHVVEVASNDGSLLQYFKQAGVPCLGIEPTASTASAAREKGIEVVQDFFGLSLAKQLAEQGKQADLTAANNVLAHVPDINDFVSGFAALLKPNGVSTFEFPHVRQLVDLNQFDTIYHEHFSYLSLLAVSRIFDANGLVVFDVESLPTHGGSLRVFAQRSDTGEHPSTDRLAELFQAEREAGLDTTAYYQGFQPRADKVKHDLLGYLIEAKREGRVVAAYGAAAKGNTLLNYAGVRPDLLCCVADRNPAKQGKFMPGSRIPIVDPAHLERVQPDDILILPWNIKDEVINQLKPTLPKSRFVTAIPSLEVIG